jgi:hypothetical protein
MRRKMAEQSDSRRLQKEIFRWVGVVALLYATVILYDCPCSTLLECKNHAAKFNAALALAVGLTAADRLMNQGSSQ